MTHDTFERQGYFLQPEFLSPSDCENFLALIQTYRDQYPVTDVYRPAGQRSLNYSVIDGLQIKAYLPEVLNLYQLLNDRVNQLAGQVLVPLANERVGCNINITRAGGSYRWHYDRNLVTAIVYLNVVDGGEIECYPNYRIFLPSQRYSRLQEMLDQGLQWNVTRQLFGRKIVVKPQPGTLLVMIGNRCLHSVCPVLGTRDRMNMVLSYDRPQATFAIANQLDTYLYSQAKLSTADPNYRRAQSDG